MHVVRTGHRRTGLTRLRRTLPAATLLALTSLAVPGTGVAAANSLSAAASPDAQAGRLMTITVSGAATTPAILRVFVQAAGAGCAGGSSGAANAEAQRQRAGSVELITQLPAGAFIYAAPYAPPVAGSYSLCAYLFGTSPGTGASQVSQSFSVAPAPPALPPVTSGSPGPGALTGPGPTRCRVPRLEGRTYLGARKLLRRAGCSVGTVYRPTHKTRKGYVLRVVGQYPKAKSLRRPRSRVLLRLGFVKRRHS